MFSKQINTQVNYLYRETHSQHATPHVFVNAYSNHIERPTLLQYYDYFIEQQKKLIGKDVTKSTVTTYTVRTRNIAQYLKAINAVDLMPSAVNIKFIREFEVWLRSAKNCRNNYVMKNIQLLGRVLNIALEHEQIKNNPIQLYNFRYDRNPVIIHLEPEELEILENKTFAQQRLQRVKDVYIFCCYTGLSYSDVLKFDRELHVIKGPDKKDCILLKRKKTNEETFLPLLPVASEILNKYGNRLPVCVNSKMNSYMKEIADLCGINKPLTTHTARKTFGMLMHNEYNVPIETVSRMLGHTSVRTTQSWYVKTNWKKVIKDMEPVTIFFNRAA